MKKCILSFCLSLVMVAVSSQNASSHSFYLFPDKIQTYVFLGVSPELMHDCFERKSCSACQNIYERLQMHEICLEQAIYSLKTEYGMPDPEYADYEGTLLDRCERRLALVREYMVEVHAQKVRCTESLVNPQEKQ